ncbi:MAG: acetoin dehydrogenase, partial [Solirubrobacterales bacterium]
KFASVARATPEKAAQIIQSGIEAGKPRIRVGGDAVIVDLMARIAPVRYYDVVARAMKLSGR